MYFISFIFIYTLLFDILVLRNYFPNLRVNGIFVLVFPDYLQFPPTLSNIHVHMITHRFQHMR